MNRNVFLFLALSLFLASPTSGFAEGSSAAAAIATMSATPTPLPAPTLVPIPDAILAPSIGVAEPAVPPQWAQDLIVAANGLPLIGPAVSKALLWTGILSGILTTSVAALLGILNLLMGVSNLAGFASFASTLAAFRDGKIMYWLKFFSNFNAKKPEDGAMIKS